MRGLALTGIALLLGCHPAASPAGPSPAPAAEIRMVWCERAYPWVGGPLTEVTLRRCLARYQEARTDPSGDLASWLWWLDKILYEEDGRIAVVTLGVLRSIGAESATFRRTYRFRWDGRAAALVGAGDVVRSDTR